MDESKGHDEEYYKRVLAHRKYQLTIAKYKALKYGNKQNKSNNAKQGSEYEWTWSDVLKNIDEAILLYNQIKVPKSGKRGQRQPIFIDLIIRLFLTKGHAYSMLNKPIKAANEFMRAHDLI